MPVNSRQKGKRVERDFVLHAKEQGYSTARRTSQVCGAAKSVHGDGVADVIIDELSKIHFEVKGGKVIRLYDAVDQVKGDKGANLGVIAHKRDRGEWLFTMVAEDFWGLVRGDHL